MNIKAYIDYFNEISHLARDQQFLLLEQARNDANTKLKLLNFSLVALLMRITFIIIIAGASYLLFGYSIGVLIASLFLALLLSRIAIAEVNSHLLAKSLKHILHEQTLKTK